MEKQLKSLIADLQQATQRKESEKAHGIYDDILLEIAYQYEPQLLEKLHILLKDTEFWYA